MCCMLARPAYYAAAGAKQTSDSGPGQENGRKQARRRRLEFSSNSCALQRRLHDAKAGDPAPYGSTGRVRVRCVSLCVQAALMFS